MKSGVFFLKKKKNKKLQVLLSAEKLEPLYTNENTFLEPSEYGAGWGDL